LFILIKNEKRSEGKSKQIKGTVCRRDHTGKNVRAKGEN